MGARRINFMVGGNSEEWLKIAVVGDFREFSG